MVELKGRIDERSVCQKMVRARTGELHRAEMGRQALRLERPASRSRGGEASRSRGGGSVADRIEEFSNSPVIILLRDCSLASVND